MPFRVIKLCSTRSIALFFVFVNPLFSEILASKTKNPAKAGLFVYRESELDLSEVLNGADHLAGIGVLVVVPRNDLDLVGVVVDLSHHGLGGVEQRTVGDTDDIGGNDLILVVAEGSGSLSLHSGVDAVNGDVLALDNGDQDGGGAGAGGNALSGTDQLAVQLGDTRVS